MSQPTKAVREVRNTKLKCPMCDKPMISIDGTKVNPKDGVTLWCNTPHGPGPGQCSAQEVTSHGKNDKDAYEAVLQFYKKTT